MVEVESANVAGILSALESLTDGFWMVDREWRIVYMNSEAERSSCRSASDLIARTLWEPSPKTAGTNLEKQYHRAASERITVEFEYFYESANRWLGIKVFPTPD